MIRKCMGVLLWLGVAFAGAAGPILVPVDEEASPGAPLADKEKAPGEPYTQFNGGSRPEAPEQAAADGDARDGSALPKLDYAPPDIEESDDAPSSGRGRRFQLAPEGTVPEDGEIPVEFQKPSPLDGFAPGPPALGDVFDEGFDLKLLESRFRRPDPGELFDLLDGESLEYSPQTGELQATGNVHMQLEGTDVHAGSLYFSRQAGVFRALHGLAAEQEKAWFMADELEYTFPPDQQEGDDAPADTPEVFQADGEEPAQFGRGTVEVRDFHLREPGRELLADRLYYDFDAQTGEAEGVEGTADIFHFGAERLRVLGPASIEGEKVWVTTCDHDPPHYRILADEGVFRQDDRIMGTGARLEAFGMSPPVYWPRWTQRIGEAAHLDLEFDSGRRAVLGYYANIGQRFSVDRNVDLGGRLYPTEKEGVGFGLEGGYDYMLEPSSWLYRSEGNFRSLYTTEERGYYDWTHRQELSPNTVLLARSEQWTGRDFYKDFYFDEFSDRSEPRSFVNIAHTRPGFIATATVRPNANDFVTETARLPEATFHLLERELAEGLYVTNDLIVGYNERHPAEDRAFRVVNTTRFTGDFPVHEAAKLTPFVELEGAYYSKEFRADRSNARFSALTGATMQTRLHREFDGALGFSGFRHYVQPSVTISYRPKPTLSLDRVPRFDYYDNVYGRTRIDTTIDNIVEGRDAETGEVWQVGRLSLFHGEDLWTELRSASYYEAELDVRPRPWWGFLTAWEHHTTSDRRDLDEPFFTERTALEIFERAVGRPFDPEQTFRFNAQYGSYRRLMSYLYYDDRALGGDFHAKAGLAYTETLNKVFNREILYGMGFRPDENWAISFEHRYDFERSQLVRQEYAVRRRLHCWEAALRARRRERGWDVRLQFNLADFPGSQIKF
ncbi:MAG: hypothetical protein ACLFU6_06200 [Candidatus Hydrogenedentota bacterium]